MSNRQRDADPRENLISDIELVVAEPRPLRKSGTRIEKQNRSARTKILLAFYKLSLVLENEGSRDVSSLDIDDFRSRDTKFGAPLPELFNPAGR